MRSEMRPRFLSMLVALAAAVAAPAAAQAESIPIEIVRNDGYAGGPVTFPSGFAAGDVLAARLAAPAGSWAVIGLEVVFGGAGGSGTHPVTVKIWDDSAETLDPGPELLSMDTELGSNGTIQLISLAGVGVPSRFRVGIVLHESAPPIVGQDADGTIDADRNLVRHATGSAWQRSQADGATGDWIIRAHLSGGGGGGGGGGACFGVDCPAGQFCDTASQRCTFECVTEDDCGGAFCNRFGQCVGEGAGCCQSAPGRGTGYVLACSGLVVLALLLRRRRRA